MNVNSAVIKNLRTEFGDAFYLLNSKQFRSNFIELRDSFRNIYSNFNIAYSYKTNYTPKLCKIVNELGGYAEVVSEMELELALRIGVPYNRIIWNGPIKEPERLEKFLVAGGTDNIDSIEELEIIKFIAEKHCDKTLNIGIRCNYDVNDGVLSRFGLDVDGEDFQKVLDYVTTTANIKFINFQCHFAKRQIEYWPARVKGMIELIGRTGIVPERIDIGGGLFGKMAESLKSQFDFDIPDYLAYSKVAAGIFSEYFTGADKPELLIEPGSALVGDCMMFIGNVKTIKNIRGKWIATVLGSQKNISMTGINPPIEIIPMGNTQKEYVNLDLVGYTCIEGDVLYKNFSGKIAREDAVVIGNCGSYSLVMKPPFILPNFPVLDISDKNIEVIKRCEGYEDLFQTFNY